MPSLTKFIQINKSLVWLSYYFPLISCLLFLDLSWCEGPARLRSEMPLKRTTWLFEVLIPRKVSFRLFFSPFALLAAHAAVRSFFVNHSQTKFYLTSTAKWTVWHHFSFKWNVIQVSEIFSSSCRCCWRKAATILICIVFHRRLRLLVLFTCVECSGGSFDRTIDF